MATSLKNLRAIWLSEKKLISRPGPSDAITFISQLYTGSISDREIVLRSSLLSQKFEDGESVMADKGFQIQDILLSGSTDDSNNIEGSMNTAFIPELDHEDFVLQQQQ